MNINSFNGYYKDTLDEFQFESGEILKDVPIEYSLRGTPKFDDDGNITNLIVVCHKFNGNHSSIGNLYELTREGEPLDMNEYCFISITSLGFPDSCCPSGTGLKHDFPKYTILDRVNFKRGLLKKIFNLNHVHGVIGQGLGGYEVYTWACEYPDEMDFIAIFNSSYKTNGYRYVFSKIIDSIIESSDDLYDDVYSESLSRMMISINKLIYSNFFSKKIFQTMTNDEIDVLMEDFVNEGLFIDIYDIKFRNDAVLDYDVGDKLHNIKAKTLIFSYPDDIYFSPEFDTIPLKELIKDSTVIMVESNRDISGIDDYSILKDDVRKFLKQFKE